MRNLRLLGLFCFVSLGLIGCTEGVCVTPDDDCTAGYERFGCPGEWHPYADDDYDLGPSTGMRTCGNLGYVDHKFGRSYGR